LDNSANETGFKVFRRIPGGAYSQIAVTPANTTSWIDSNVSPGSQYYYTVCATGSAIDSGFFTEVSVEAPSGQ
ncbi:MAG TPA: fibronectin type III domain-containing protein, partial [Pyrinomonadaceae bacterium]|nr:fibronectin type III domain-containing protein [Pyrinomonadaceae bacterium]